jgi:hypothetical protein
MSYKDTIETDILIIGGGSLRKVAQLAATFYQVLLLNHPYLKNYYLMQIFQRFRLMPEL